jgi:hypothetical protein
MRLKAASPTKCVLYSFVKAEDVLDGIHNSYFAVKVAIETGHCAGPLFFWSLRRAARIAANFAKLPQLRRKDYSASANSRADI